MSSSLDQQLESIPDEVLQPSSEDLYFGRVQSDQLFFDLEIAKVARYKYNTSSRVGMSIWAAVIITGWLACVVVILMKNERVFCLSDDVLKILLTTTTINVIGIILICFKDLFNGKSESKIADSLYNIAERNRG